MKITIDEIRKLVEQELQKEDCWDGYERVPGSTEGAPGSCRKKAKKKKLKEEEVEEGKICDKGIQYVMRTDPGGKDIKRGKEDKDGDGENELENWSARAAQIASKYCKDPNYGKGRGKDAKEGKIHEEEGGLKKWEKENWTHSDGTPCGGGKKDGSSKRCKPAAKWKTMSKSEKAADNAKKKKGTKAGKQYVSATKKGKVTEGQMKKLLTEWRQFLNEGAVEKEISKTLSDEGGAAGFDPLHKAAKKVEKDISKKEVEDTIKKMDNVTKHRDGDYIKEESEYEAAMRRLKDKAEAGSVSIEVDPDPEGEEDIDLDPYDDEEEVTESRSSYNRDTIRKMVEEEIEKLNEKPAKGKKSSKTYTNPKTGRKNKVSYGQKGATISPGTSKGDSYCARSFGIKKDLPKSKQNDPNTPNNLSRKKWKCKGAKSSK